MSTMDILSASTGHKYSASDILKKIDFTMTDSTSHNLGVMKMACNQLQVESVPPALLCNVHPLMMFQNKQKQLCQQIQDALGKRKIKDCFLVDVEFQSESFVVKAIKRLSNFINKDSSSKPWNRSDHFSDFIKPKENMLISLKDHRFNRLNDCCLTILYHLDDIASYLEKFNNITNGIAILDRGFVEMEILKPIFAAIALLGVHVTRPFHKLLMDPSTDYSQLLNVYPQLYGELTTIKLEKVLQLLNVYPQLYGELTTIKLEEVLQLLTVYPQLYGELTTIKLEEVLQLLNVCPQLYGELTTIKLEEVLQLLNVYPQLYGELTTIKLEKVLQLLNVYPQLYGELTTIKLEEVLQHDKQVFHFVSHNVFCHSLPGRRLLESLHSCISMFPEEIKKLVRLLLKMFADGLDYQKGDIFGFGPSALKDTAADVLKISAVSKEELSTLDKNVQVHNIGEERNVGMINYELSIRGKDNLESTTRKVVLNKSSDLMLYNSTSFKKYKKQSD